MDESPSLNIASAVTLGAALVLALPFFLWPSSTVSPTFPVHPPASIAAEVWAITADGAPADVLVLLQEEADLAAARQLTDREERVRAIYHELRTTALRSQAGLRAELEAAGVDYRPFYLVNAIALRAERELLTQLVARPEVVRIVANPSVRQELPQPDLNGLEPQTAGGVEWNVAQIRADAVWDLGYSGEGIVVAGQDTGYEWQHPALIQAYRGYNGVTATHDYNWHDAIHQGGGACGVDSPYPCDDGQHGTHTMGTMVGDDGVGNQIGVAPGAQWIGCRNMDEGWGTPASYIECFEFFLAPYPVGGDPFTEGEPSLAPHVINNSWTCPPYEGCEPATLQAVVEHVRAAGIMVVASAGNSGSSCSSVKHPPATYDAAFSVGATDRSDVIAGFSGRGPVTVDGWERMKPDVSAPGVDIRSSVPGGGYQGGWSGTSMAGPHVAGTAALLWSAVPQLIGDVEGTEEIIARTARARTTSQGCGEDGLTDVPNNVYGWGIVNALAAAPERWLSRIAQVEVLDGLPVGGLRYTLTLTNIAPVLLTDVMITQTIPLKTTLAWAQDDYSLVGTTVFWDIPIIAPGGVVSRGLEVYASDCLSGSCLRSTYGLRAGSPPVRLGQVQADVVVPWRILLFPVFKNAGSGGS